MAATDKEKAEFLDAYVATALWSTTDNATESGGEPLDANHDETDIAPDAFAQMMADCISFLAMQADTLDAAIASGKVKYGPDFGPYGRAGHDFWLTRNGHGAGFWDGDWPEPQATALTDAAKAFRECDLYVGDDGQIYC